MSTPGTESPPLLVPLLERIYESGQMETPAGEPRSAATVGVPRMHAVRLAELVRDHELLNTLETGMAYGLSTLAIAGVHEARGRGRHIAIDPAENDMYDGVGLHNVHRAGLQDRVRFISAGSQLALPRLVEEGTGLDFALIDGMHLFDYALVDFFYLDAMLASGGFVAFHDVWMPAVDDAVRFVLANRAYEQSSISDDGMAVLRKRGPDRRRWDHYHPFATPRPLRPASRDEQAGELFDRMREGAEQAARRLGGFREHSIYLAGSPVRMRFAGPALEPAMLPAFAHALGGGDEPPELDILLWESKESDVPAPNRPWGVGDVRARGDVRGYEGPKLSVLVDPVSAGTTVFDRDRATIVYWVSNAGQVPWYESGAPLRAALHQWVAGPDRHFVHAGAVGRGDVGVLVAGASGSGKSTTALACLEAGMEYVGDDYVVLTGGEQARAHCLYSTAKLDAEALERLPGLAAAVSEYRRGDEVKSVLQLHRHRPDLLRPSLRVEAIVLPWIGQGEQPSLQPASGAAALRALAPTTLIQLPGAGRLGMDAVADVVRRVPAFSLELGSDVAAVPDLIAGLCREHTPARSHARAGRG